ncbi:hypothetical protein PR048_029927 [Dryococelus australis]|uniref:Uncharacterized protein n=1 Tax=Dryococelus australis TaxID=614101 RepID=A0ABQ9GBG8_9NEOP|nr:hypothetical protein PR048_029927 [Dryococelus australis]
MRAVQCPNHKKKKSYVTGRNGGPSLTTAFEGQLQRPAPPNKTILYWVDMFRQTGSVGNRNARHFGRPRSTRSNENVGWVMEKVLQSPKKSFRRMSEKLHLETTAVWRMVKENGSRSCRTQVLHELKAPDCSARMQYSGRVLSNLCLDQHFIDDWWLSEELSVKINGSDFKCEVFQQDGATAHVGRGNLALLHELFPNRAASRGSAFPYSPRSPYLTVCDAFLWGMIKQKCFNLLFRICVQTLKLWSVV